MFCQMFDRLARALESVVIMLPLIRDAAFFNDIRRSDALEKQHRISSDQSFQSSI